MSIDTKYINHKKREKARKWFAHKGINPDNTFINPEDRQFYKLDFPPIPVKYENATPIQCQIDIISFLVYCHVTVLFNDPVSGDEWKYEGGSGGLGIGDISAEGILTYGSIDVLTKATTFEVSFVTVDGGGTQVSWGSSGNAFAAGVGDGFGVFGGSGGWTNVG